MKYLFTQLCIGLAAVAPALGDSLELDNSQPAFTFNYETDTPDATNWIGIYKDGKGPVDGEKHGDPAWWTYTEGVAGMVLVQAWRFDKGKTYNAHFLGQDGWQDLASSVEFVGVEHIE